MSMDNSIPIFRLYFNHDFFDSGFLSFATVNSDAETAQRLTHYQLEVRCIPNNGIYNQLGLFYLGHQKIDKIINHLIQLLGDAPLIFNISGLPETFCIVTDIPPDSVPQVIFSNLVPESESSIGTDHKNHSRNSSEICLHPVIEQPFIEPDNIGRVYIYPRQLQQDLSHGLYQYTVTMAVRKLPRCYFIGNEGRVRKLKLSIETSKGAYFKDQEKPIIINGTEYRLLDSGDQVMPLKSRPEDTLSLISEAEADPVTGFIKRDVLILRLPDPILENFTVRRKNGKAQPCCDMFVNI